MAETTDSITTNPGMLAAGARPAAMWVGVATILYIGIGLSFLNWLALCLHLPPFPPVSDTAAQYAVGALLGIGALRSFDKAKGTDTRVIGQK